MQPEMAKTEVILGRDRMREYLAAAACSDKFAQRRSSAPGHENLDLEEPEGAFSRPGRVAAAHVQAARG